MKLIICLLFMVHTGNTLPDLKNINNIVNSWQMSFPRKWESSVMKTYYTYIMASKRNGTLYIGVTNDLSRRVYEHKNHLGSKFVNKYKVTMLVYYETTGSIVEAIRREKQLKKWYRGWKLKLIEGINPTWKDLAYELDGSPLSRG